MTLLAVKFVTIVYLSSLNGQEGIMRTDRTIEEEKNLHKLGAQIAVVGKGKDEEEPRTTIQVPIYEKHKPIALNLWEQLKEY